MNIKKISILSILAMTMFANFTPKSYAMEADPFTARFSIIENLPDASPWLDKWMNDHIKEAVARLNSKRDKDEKRYSDNPMLAIHDEIVSRISETYFSPIEDWFSHGAPEEMGRFQPKKHGIYRHALLKDMKSAVFVGVSTIVNIGNSFVHADKLGHFTGQGWQYFEIYEAKRAQGKTHKQAVRAAVEKGHLWEIGSLGLASDGVFADADLAANYQGLLFYLNFFGGENPYVSSDGDKFYQARDFHWSEWVTDDWDEALNPSHMVSKRLANLVKKNVKKICKANPWWKGMTPSGSGRWLNRADFTSKKPIPGYTVKFGCN